MERLAIAKAGKTEAIAFKLVGLCGGNGKHEEACMIEARLANEQQVRPC